MATQVTLTQQELLSLSPEVRAPVCEATSNWWTPPNKETTNKDINVLADDPELLAAFNDLNNNNNNNGPMTLTFVNSIFVSSASSAPQAGSLVIPDPYQTYLKTLVPEAVPDTLVVTRELSALWSIFLLVDHQQHVKSIIDLGSQIVAMSEEVCMEHCLIYDLTIILNMQSANGEVDQSLGLARNIPLQIGDITLYVQIHIIWNPAFDILLGRPFNILTKSIIRNFANEDQTLTIRNPNTGLWVTIPTVQRGGPHQQLKRPSFMMSRIWLMIKEISRQHRRASRYPRTVFH